MDVWEEKKKCAGCGLCEKICPVNAISMVRKEDSFFYPVIDVNKCIGCNKCRKFCPSSDKIIANEEKKCYAVMASNDIRERSSSGGCFSLIAKKVIGGGGFVCGAAFVNQRVQHVLVHRVEDIELLRTSKYVQSDIRGVMDEIKEKVKSRIVLFSGTPCQVAAVKRYVSDTSGNLLTADIVCMGVPSAYIFEKYLKEEFSGKVIDKVNFRHKKEGWTYNLFLNLIDMSQKSTVLNHKESSYFTAFLKGYSLRESCGSCSFATSNRVGDVTIGDFWRIWDYDKALDDRKGTSLCMVNSVKGTWLVEDIFREAVMREVPLNIAIKGNRTLDKHTDLPPERRQFLMNLHEKTLKENIKEIMDEKADYGIINYWYANDHGAILTAFALQRLLGCMGITTRLINCCPEGYLAKRDNGISQKFEKSNLIVTEKVYNSYEKYPELNEKYKGFLVGSDQVFRTEWVSDDWFLRFCNEKKIRVAVSASFGIDELTCSDERKKRISQYLHKFSAISVRENSGVELCKKEFDIDAECVLDPVFLVDFNEYERLIDKSEVDVTEEYIFCYIRDMNHAIEQMIERISDKNLKVIYVNEAMEIEDFLKYCKNSKMVITDSYHGLCFSVIYKKDYICLVNKKRGSTRFYSIRDRLGLACNSFVETENIESVKEIPHMKHACVEERLQDERAKGLDWIKANVVENILKLSNEK